MPPIKQTRSSKQVTPGNVYGEPQTDVRRPGQVSADEAAQIIARMRLARADYQDSPEGRAEAAENDRARARNQLEARGDELNARAEAREEARRRRASTPPNSRTRRGPGFGERD